MRVKSNIIYLLTISICLCKCSDKETISKEFRGVRQPLFNDLGKAIESLKNVYNCESVDFENWEDNNETDSCLTVRLINSTKVPLLADIDEPVNELETIASSKKKALAKPQAYKSFYIIFIKKEFVNGEEIQVHSAGMEVASAAL